MGQQFILVDAAQFKEKLRLFVESRTNAIERRRDVLAHVGPVRTAARQLDFLGRWKEAVALLADSVHDALGQPTLKEFDHGVDLSSAIPADGVPARGRDRRDGNLDLVERRTRD